MTWMLLSFLLLAAALLVILIWALRGVSKSSENRDLDVLTRDSGQSHAIHFLKVRQLFSADDLALLSLRGSPRLAKRVRKDRRLIALDYLNALHQDFRGLLQLARALAALSPEVAAQDESERFWLSVRFAWRFQITRAVLLLGFSPLPQLHGMIQMIGSLSVRLDTALARLGEDMLQTRGLASPLNRSGMNLS